jgi:hypothetical protein
MNDLTNPNDLSAYLAVLQTPSDVPSIDSDINLNKLTKRIVITKDSPELLIKLDKEQVASSKVMYVLIEDGYASRALFVPSTFPGKENLKGPICATGLVPIDSVAYGAETCKGNATVIDDLEPPYRPADIDLRAGDVRSFDCNKCQWNKFETEGAWDEAKNGKGKACKESRAYFVRPLVKVKGSSMTLPNKEEIFAFEQDADFDEPVRMILSLGANRKGIDQMIVSARARKLPVTSCVWKIGVNIVDMGAGVKFAQMTFEFAGIPTPATFALAKGGDKAWVADFVSRNAKHGVEDVEMPFG